MHMRTSRALWVGLRSNRGWAKLSHYRDQWAVNGLAHDTKKFLLRGPLLRRKMWLTSLAERFLFAGITTMDCLVRRRQLFTNIATYVALIACVHFTVNAACNFAGLLVVNGVHSRPA